MRTQVAIVLLVGLLAVVAVGCEEAGSVNPANPSVGGLDGGRVGPLAVRPGELTSGTGTEPGTPGGGGATPGVQCQDGTPWLQVNVDPAGIVKWQVQLLAGATVYHPEIRRGDDGTGAVVWNRAHETVFGQTAGPLPSGRYTMTIRGYRPTCRPQMGDASALVRFSIQP